MHKIPLFSVVVPTDRFGQDVRCCLKSLRLQTLDPSDFEVILVLDGFDGRERSAMDYDHGLPLRVIVSSRQQGRSASRNAGLSCATGRWIVSIDGDMIACPTLLETYASAMSDKRCCIGSRLFTLPYATLLEDLNGTFDALRPGLLRKCDYRDSFYVATHDLSRALEPFWAFSTCNCSFSRKAALDIGLFDEHFQGWGLEDQEFGFRLWRQAQSEFLYIKEAEAIHIEHARNMGRERASWRRNRDYCVQKHGSIFIDPIGSILRPLTLDVNIDPKPMPTEE